LKPAYLDEAKHWAGRVTALRDAHAPGKPVWLAETGNAQFGGEPGVSDVYIGGLWWLDQLGLLARMGHSVVVRQTLSGMTYALIEDENLFPRPDYWNSLLWKRLMSPDVYAATVAGDNSARLRAYCHGTPGTEDGRTLLIINLDPERSASVIWPALDERPWELYHLNAPDTLGNAVHLNGAPLGLTPEGYLPAINGRRMSASGEPGIRLPPLTYAFVAVVGD